MEPPCESNCNTPVAATCSDLIKNQDETAVDCGGVCSPCLVAPTCSDAMQNGGETGVDCGGACSACALPCDDAVSECNVPRALAIFSGQLGASGTADGAAEQARFGEVTSLAVDSRGVLFVSEANRIRTISSTGVVTTIAGSVGDASLADGPGLDARFVSARGIAVIGNGETVFVADGTRIRMLSQDNGSYNVSTVAGSATAGSTNGSGLSATFTRPFGLALSGSYLFISDLDTRLIRRMELSAPYVVTTPIGNGTADETPGLCSSSGFDSVGDIAFLQVGSTTSLFIAEQLSNNVRKAQLLTGSCSLDTFAGPTGPTSGFDSGYVDLPGGSARFDKPFGVAAASGTVFVADRNNNAIRQLTQNTVTTVLGSGAGGSVDGVGSGALLNHPSDVAAFVDPMTNALSLLVADSGNFNIRLHRLATQTTTTLAGPVNPYPGPGCVGSCARQSERLDRPTVLATCPSGRVYFFEARQDTIRFVDPSGVIDRVLTLYPGVSGLGCDADDNLYLSVEGTSRVSKLLSTDFSATDAVVPGNPQGLVVMANGDVLVACSGSHDIKKVVFGVGPPVVSAFAGVGMAGYADGTATSAARFLGPRDVEVDAAGRVYVADSGNHCIRRIANGVVSTAAGSCGNAGAINDNGHAARFNTPIALAIAPNGNLFVAEEGNASVRRIRSPQSTSALVTTFIGQLNGRSTGVLLGALPARINLPLGLGVDQYGAVYVTSENAVLVAQ